MNSTIIKKTFTLLFLLSFFTFFFSCQPISSEQDAKNFSNAMIKAFFVGDEDFNKAVLSESSRTITINDTGINSSNFANSHFINLLNNEFSYGKMVFSNSEISYEDSTYIVNGDLFYAVYATTNSVGFQATLVLFGSLEVTKDGKNQDVSFDAKYTISFNFPDEISDDIYIFSFSGSLQSYVNDFVVIDNSWTISFSGKIFGFGI